MEINHIVNESASVLKVPVQPHTAGPAGGDAHKFIASTVWIPSAVSSLIRSFGLEGKINSIRWLRAMYSNLTLCEAKTIVEYYIGH